MQRFWEITKAHPFWIFGGVLFFILVFWFWGRGGKTEQASGVFAQTQDPNLLAQQTAEFVAQNQSNAAISVAGIQAGTYGQAIAAQLTALENTNAAQLAAATANASAAVAIEHERSLGATALATVQGSTAQAINASNNAANVQLAQVAAQKETTIGAATAFSANIQNMLAALTSLSASAGTVGTSWTINNAGGSYTESHTSPNLTGNTIEEMYSNVIRYAMNINPYQTVIPTYSGFYGQQTAGSTTVATNTLH